MKPYFHGYNDHRDLTRIPLPQNTVNIPIVPTKGTLVMIAGESYKVTEVEWDYDKEEVRVIGEVVN